MERLRPRRRPGGMHPRAGALHCGEKCGLSPGRLRFFGPSGLRMTASPDRVFQQPHSHLLLCLYSDYVVNKPDKQHHNNRTIILQIQHVIKSSQKILFQALTTTGWSVIIMTEWSVKEAGRLKAVEENNVAKDCR